MSRFKPTNENNEKNIVLCVSRINKIKGLEFLIKAIPYVVKSFPDVKLRIVGKVLDQNYFRDLNRLVSNLKCEKFVEFDISSCKSSEKIFLK